MGAAGKAERSATRKAQILYHGGDQDCRSEDSRAGSFIRWCTWAGILGAARGRTGGEGGNCRGGTGLWLATRRRSSVWHVRRGSRLDSLAAPGRLYRRKDALVPCMAPGFLV